MDYIDFVANTSTKASLPDYAHGFSCCTTDLAGDWLFEHDITFTNDTMARVAYALEPDTSYQFKIYAFNLVGEGQASPEATAVSTPGAHMVNPHYLSV